MLRDYVVVDLEMTGLKAKEDRILEIGAVKVEEGHMTGTFHKLVNPERELSEKIIELTGITNEMAQTGCDVKEAVEGFLSFAGNLPFIGHNILFDYSFLKQYAANHGIILEKEGLDTLKLARKFLPDAEKKTLDYLCEYFEIPREQNHRALEDAKATALLFELLQNAFEQSEPGAFCPLPLKYKAKKQSPITIRQKNDLQELAACHKIDLKVELDSLTKNEASRMIDKILSNYGKVST